MANLKLMNNEMAVSPIVATLVLIVVAVIGAVAVGTIMGTFSTDVSKQANSGNAASQAQTEIIVAGSTTLQPLELNLKTDYELAHPGIKINVQGGGSGAGVSSVAMGISDIGASSAASKVTSAQAANPSSTDYQNLYVALIGGRGVAWITNSASPATAGTGIDKADLIQAYTKANVGANGVTVALQLAAPQFQQAQSLSPVLTPQGLRTMQAPTSSAQPQPLARPQPQPRPETTVSSATSQPPQTPSALSTQAMQSTTRPASRSTTLLRARQPTPSAQLT